MYEKEEEKWLTVEFFLSSLIHRFSPTTIDVEIFLLERTVDSFFSLALSLAYRSII